MSEAFDTEGASVAFRLSVRGMVVAAASTVAIAAPVAAALAGQPAAQTLADCSGVNIPIYSQGLPVDTCPAPVAPPAGSGGAPSQDLLIACSGIAGCLSNAMYGPGNVVVPSPNTRVQQSQ